MLLQLHRKTSCEGRNSPPLKEIKISTFTEMHGFVSKKKTHRKGHRRHRPTPIWRCPVSEMSFCLLNLTQAFFHTPPPPPDFSGLFFDARNILKSMRNHLPRKRFSNLNANSKLVLEVRFRDEKLPFLGRYGTL